MAELRAVHKAAKERAAGARGEVRELKSELKQINQQQAVLTNRQKAALSHNGSKDSSKVVKQAKNAALKQPDELIHSLDVFAGCGGLSFMAEAQLPDSNCVVRSRWAVDNWSDACKTFEQNHRGVTMFVGSAEDYLELLKRWDALCTEFENYDLTQVSSASRCAVSHCAVSHRATFHRAASHCAALIMLSLTVLPLPLLSLTVITGRGRRRVRGRGGCGSPRGGGEGAATA